MQQLLHTKALVTKATEEDGILEAVVGSTSLLDRYGDVVEQDGWILKNFMKNPVILWGHNVREERPPIGRALKVWLEGARKKRLMFKLQFDMADQFAAEVFRKYKDGFLHAFSVGFIPLEWEDNTFMQMELLELSAVPVPANPEAIMAIKSMKGVHPIDKIEDLFKPKKEDLHTLFPEMKIVENKKALPYKELGIAPETETFDGPGEIAKASPDDLKLMSAWVDDEKLEDKGSYKLVHHRQLDKKAVWRGVLSAMAMLMGGQGGVEIPEADRKKVYNHLAKHYAEFKKEAPEFKHVEEQTLKGLENEVSALILNREEKHVVRLIKNLTKVVKTQTAKPAVKTNPTDADVAEALQIIDKALEKSLKGGE